MNTLSLRQLIFKSKILVFFTAFLLAGAIFLVDYTFVNRVAAQSIDQRRAQLESQIKKLEAEAALLDKQLKKVSEQKRTLSREISKLEVEIKQRQIAIRRINLAIQQTALEIENKENNIAELTKRIGSSQKSLSASIRLLSRYDDDNLLAILLKNNTLSEFFATLNNLQDLQRSIKNSLTKSKQARQQLVEEKKKLEENKREQEQLKAIQEVERRLFAQKKREKDELLRVTKGKESTYQKLLADKRRNITALRTQLFYLEKTGITAEDAVKFAELAASRTGIRTAFLLALLEVETGKRFANGTISVGTNLGTGNWKDDMYLCYKRLAKYYSNNKYNIRAEREKEAFFSITQKLGLDPNKMPVSKEPPYIGCGGAMGPAQFLPSTWLLFEKRVAKLTGHNPPNPWDVEDAFTAAAIFLADAGASSKTTNGEIRAAKTYISGNPNCSRYICRSYANQIISLAKDIERSL